jgi:hypothetical protein
MSAVKHRAMSVPAACFTIFPPIKFEETSLVNSVWRAAGLPLFEPLPLRRHHDRDGTTTALTWHEADPTRSISCRAAKIPGRSQRSTPTQSTRTAAGRPERSAYRIPRPIPEALVASPYSQHGTARPLPASRRWACRHAGRPPCEQSVRSRRCTPSGSWRRRRREPAQSAIAL